MKRNTYYKITVVEYFANTGFKLHQIFVTCDEDDISTWAANGALSAYKSERSQVVYHTSDSLDRTFVNYTNDLSSSLVLDTLLTNLLVNNAKIQDIKRLN